MIVKPVRIVGCAHRSHSMSGAYSECTQWGSVRGRRAALSDRTLVFFDSFTRAAGDVELFHAEVGESVFTSAGIGTILSLFSFGECEGVEVRLMARARTLATPRPYHGAAELLLTHCFAIMPLAMIEGPCDVTSMASYVGAQNFDEDRFYISAADFATKEGAPVHAPTYLAAEELPSELQAAVELQVPGSDPSLLAAYLDMCLSQRDAPIWEPVVHLFTTESLRALRELPSLLRLWSGEGAREPCSYELPLAEALTAKAYQSLTPARASGNSRSPSKRVASPVRRLTRSTRASGSPRKRLIVEETDDELEGSEDHSSSDEELRDSGTSPMRRSRRIPRVQRDKKKLLQQRIDDMTQERATVLGSKRSRVIEDDEEEVAVPLDAVDGTPSPKKVTKLGEMSWMEQVEQGMQPDGLELQEVPRLSRRSPRKASGKVEGSLRAGELIRELKQRKSPVRVKLKQSLLPVIRVKEDGSVSEEDEELFEPVRSSGVTKSRLRKRKRAIPSKRVSDLLFDSDDEPLAPKQTTLEFVGSASCLDSENSLDGFIVEDGDIEESAASSGGEEDKGVEELREGDTDKRRGGSVSPAKYGRGPFPDDDSFEVRQVFTLKQAMGVYVQYLATCILDPEFAEDLRQQPKEGYYTPAKDKIEHAIRYRKNSLVSSQAWHVSFRKSMQKHSEYRAWARPSNIDCEACGRSGHTATYDVSLEGLVYDSEALWDARLSPYDLVALFESGAGHEEDPPQFKLGKHCKFRTRLWHQLHHYKFNVIMKIRRRLKALSELDPCDALKAVIDDDRFIMQQFDTLLTLINDCDSFGTEDGKR